MSTITAPFVAGSETSESAARSMDCHLSRLESLVLLVLRGFDDQQATDEEIWLKMPSEVKESTARARRVALCDKGLIVDSGRTKLSSSKRPMTIWQIASENRLTKDQDDLAQYMNDISP